MQLDNTINGGMDWPVYRCEVSYAPHADPYCHGKYIVGPGGCCELLRCEAGEWLVCSAFDKYCHAVKVPLPNGRWDYQFALRIAVRIAKYGTTFPPAWDR
jgi:hypothetical protein